MTKKKVLYLIFPLLLFTVIPLQAATDEVTATTPTQTTMSQSPTPNSPFSETTISIISAIANFSLAPSRATTLAPSLAAETGVYPVVILNADTPPTPAAAPTVNARPIGHDAVSPNTAVAKLLRPESFRVRIENRVSGNIAVSRDDGATWEVIGQVIQPNKGRIHDIQDGQFTASDWAAVGGIAATAVNAIHVKVGHSGKHGQLFSILPSELTDESLVKGSYRSESTSIITDIHGGARLFGHGAGVLVGDPLYWVTPTMGSIPWPAGKAPMEGDIIEIISQRTPVVDWTLEFENRVGGYVTYREGADTPTIVAIVEKPVSGSGRFLGGRFQGPGKVRANHPGVIDIKTAESGVLGGFQVVPHFHAEAPNLAYVNYTHCYMVVGSVSKAPLEGTFPLFQQLIRPGDKVEGKVKGIWQPLPESAGLNPTGLTQLEGFRIRPAKRYLKLTF